MRSMIMTAGALLLFAGTSTAVVLPQGHSGYVEMVRVVDTGDEMVFGQAPCSQTLTDRVMTWAMDRHACTGAGYVWAYRVGDGRPWEGRVISWETAAVQWIGDEPLTSLRVHYETPAGAAEALAAHISAPVEDPTGQVVNFALPVPETWDDVAYEEGPDPSHELTLGT